MSTKRLLGLLLLGGAAGCGGAASLQDGRHPTGSQAMVASSDFQALYAANPDDGTVVRYAIGDHTTLKAAVGGEPTRIARVKDHIFVTLRAGRAVAIVQDTGGELKIEGAISVGAEPYGIVASEDGARLYVASSLSGFVQEIDPQSRTVLRTWTVPDEPRWLALRPDGQSLYVGSALNGRLSRIDLGSREGTVESLSLPNIDPQFVPSRAPGGPQALSPRITGDLAVTPDGSRLLVPGLYVDNHSVVVEPKDPKTPDTTGTTHQPGTSFPAGGGYSPGKFNPVIVAASLDGDGRINAKDAPMIRTDNTGAFGYPVAVTSSPDSKIAYAVIEGSGAVSMVSLEAPAPDSGNIFKAIFGGSSPSQPPMSFTFRPSVAVGVAFGPKSVAVMSDSRAFAFALIDHKIDEIDLTQPVKILGQRQSGGGVVFGAGASSAGAVPVKGIGGVGTVTFPFNALRSDPIANETLSADAAKGRRLFYATNNPAMSGTGVGVSCATCHFEVRTDGLTWSFDRGGRQTPSLAGKVSLTQPVRWEGDRATVADDAFDTSQNLMGGSGLTLADANAIQAFIDSGRDVDVPLRGSTDERVLKGKAIFERPEVGCAGCHNGPRMTNNSLTSMFGLDTVKVRSLVGIVASPPYLHDGSKATLKDVVLGSRTGAMGNTGSLDDEEIDDLVLYLESL